MNVGFISLGCSKNQVDTEIMIGLLKKSGYKIVNALERADIIIINTCGFIDDAKEEAINTIIETGRLKEKGILKHLLAAGCLTQRYGRQLLDEMPELDGIVGISSFLEISDVLKRVINGERVSLINEAPDKFIEKGPRVLTTPPGSAYLKISEGCRMHCSYCAIPYIRGKLRSRPVDELIEEAEYLADRGVKELVIIAQDTMSYGKDLNEDHTLHKLLHKLGHVEGIEWTRLMYLHPYHINEEFIDFIASEPKVLPYIDMPVQHASDKLLQSMHRRHDKAKLEKIIRAFKNKLDDVVLRTTVMLGFPGETEDDFKILYDFVAETEFDWLGAFTFNSQEGTPAHNMPGKVPLEMAEERKDAILKLQKNITRQKNLKRIERQEKILVSRQIADKLYLGRGFFQAPEVDGVTLIKSNKKLATGNFVNVQLKGIRNYDMIGEIHDEYSK